MRFLVGTSGFSYPKWKGLFYPAKLPASEMLRFYAERFGSVEIDSTFYRMPQESVLTSWTSQVPADFRFSLKASQRITHFQRLKGSAESVEYFFRNATCLGERTGPVLFQLPPNLKMDLALLGDFLELIPRAFRVAFEFRNASWFDDRVYDLLRAKSAALCIAQDEKLTTPLVATAPFGYLRLRTAAYEDRELAEWAEGVQHQTWGEVFIYFKHEDQATGPVFAERFLSLLAGG